MTHTLLVRAFAIAVAASLWSASAVQAQSVTSVDGTNNSLVDVPSVQYALDHFDIVQLRGTFSFAAAPGLARDYVEITRPVAVLGAQGGESGATWILGGTKPFRVNAPGQAVAMTQLGFAEPRLAAIEVTRVRGLSVERCTIATVLRGAAAGLPPTVPGAYGIAFAGAGGEIGGDIVLRGNDITIGGTAAQRTAGIINMPTAFAPDTSLTIAHNTIRDTTAHGVDIRNVRGTAVIEHNTVLTGSVGAQPAALPDNFVDGIRCVGAGAYFVLRNDVEMPFANGAGIRIQGNAMQPIVGALVEGNLIRMSAVNGTFGSQSAGVDLRRQTTDVQVLANSVQGFARAALVVDTETATMFSSNASLYHRKLPSKSRAPLTGPDLDVFIGAGSQNTRVTLGTALPSHDYTIDDRGTGTVVAGPGR